MRAIRFATLRLRGRPVEMVVKVHCGTVLEDKFAATSKMRPPKQSHNALENPSRASLPRNLKVANNE